MAKTFGAFPVFFLIFHFLGLNVGAEGVNMKQNEISIDSDYAIAYKPALTAYSKDYCSSVYIETPPSGYVLGLFGSACSDMNHGAGSYVTGVMGIASGELMNEPYGGYGVYGKATSSGLRSGYGVYGVGKDAGVYGKSDSAGVHGVSDSASGYAGYFVTTSKTNNTQSAVYLEAYFGNLIEGYETLTTDPWRDRRFYVDRSGDVYADGSFHGGGADVAESVVLEDESISGPGHVLEISQKAAKGSHTFALSSTPYSTRVAGIYSTKPGFLGQRWEAGDPRLDEEIPMAVVGIVPCRVSAENGPIQRGDLLVSAGTPGHAMKGTDRLRMIGAVIGKALENLDAGTGLVDVLVTLQ